MDTTLTVIAAFVITAVIATAIYFLVLQRKKGGAVNKHPHFEPRATRDRELGNDGRNYPNATRVNGGYSGGGGFPG